jgi:hypothetical protein
MKQNQIYFITFTAKLDPQKSKQILNELRKRYPNAMLIFSPRPVRGKRLILNISDEIVIVTIPRQTQQQASMPEQASQSSTQSGFKLKELIKK